LFKEISDEHANSSRKENLTVIMLGALTLRAELLLMVMWRILVLRIARMWYLQLQR
jgi:hypothetical protein